MRGRSPHARLTGEWPSVTGCFPSFRASVMFMLVPMGRFRWVCNLCWNASGQPHSYSMAEEMQGGGGSCELGMLFDWMLRYRSRQELGIDSCAPSPKSGEEYLAPAEEKVG